MKTNGLDDVLFEIVSSALISITEEMGSALKRSSYSPIIRDMEDFSCALFTGRGDLVAQADYIPAQLGAMSLVVNSIIDRWGASIGDGDVFIANHPFMGAMHLPDVNVICPIFVDGRLFGWAGATAHHIDVGGVNPGSEGPSLRDIYSEGLIIPPIRLEIGGIENADFVSLISANIRDPLSTVSDLRAQRAACHVGRDRVCELARQYGAAALGAVMDEMLETSERGTRRALAALPDGAAEAEGFLDDDGLGGPPTRIHVAVSKTGDHLEIDLSGSDPEVAGAMNVPWASTRAGVVYAVRAVIAQDVETNDGILRPLRIVCPRGTVLNPNPPAAVSIRHNTCQRLADTLIRAFGTLWPDKAVASSSVTFFCINIGSTNPASGRPSVLADCVGGGTGATPTGDGIDGVDTYMSNVGVMPAEVVETNYQVRVLRSELVPGSQGNGKFRGGMGFRREYQILDHEQRVTYYGEQTQSAFAPVGLQGGDRAQPTTVTLIGPDGSESTARPKGSLPLGPGTIIRVETAGGAGFGDLRERPEELRRADSRNGIARGAQRPLGEPHLSKAP